MILLTGGRLVWLELFKPEQQPYATNGLLNLQGFDLLAAGSITLDGQWEFYPGVWLQDEEEGQKHNAKFIHIPGGWNSYLETDQDTPFGYGSYRLQIMLDADERHSYSLYVPSVRSSSELFVNGDLVASVGKPASSPDQYIAGNAPYTATFSAEAKDTIEIVIHTANYIDPRSGGLIRSIKFGMADAIDRENILSMTMQILVAVAMLIQAINLLVIFVMERNARWLYYALLMISMLTIMLNSSEDKLLLLWFRIPYDWSFKLLNISLLLFVYALLNILIRYYRTILDKRIDTAITVISLFFLGMVIWSPISWQIYVQFSILSLFLLPIIVLLIFMLRRLTRDIRYNLLFILTFLAIANNFGWWLYFMIVGMKIMYYPFDHLIALVTMSSIWFKNYLTLYTEQKKHAHRLQSINLQKDEFLANTSHELRNPLHGIINISEVVLERERAFLQNKSIHELETVLAVGRRMSIMLDDLLDVTRLKDGNVRLSLKQLSLQSIVSGVLDMLRGVADDKQLALVNKVPERFPFVWADENKLVQILFNLVHNAVKYTDKGEVTITAYVEQEQAHIVIADTGKGIDEQILQRIFLPYERGDDEDNAYIQGFGLGLNICRQLIGLHGGEIWVESTPGEGSRFTFTLRLGDAREVQHDINENSEQFVAAAEARSELHIAQQDHVNAQLHDKLKILAVDDELINLRILTSVLSEDAYYIRTVTKGTEALSLLQSDEWDLVISDIMMPHMSGYELTRKIRERFSMTDLPVLLLTARNRSEDIEQGFLAGANDYVSKPFDSRELKSRVGALAQLKKSVRETLRMEGSWLQAQIEPHFFYNTLNSITALQVIDPEKMVELIEHFSHFLRRKFHFKTSSELIPIKDEFELIRSYLFIEKVRYDEKLQVEWDVDDINLRVPPYTIQPLVENAIKHGIMKRNRGGLIRIRLKQLDDGAVVSITDNGIGMRDEDFREKLSQGLSGSSGVGLRNVDRRLKRYFGSGLQFQGNLGTGTTVSFMIRSNGEKIYE